MKRYSVAFQQLNKETQEWEDVEDYETDRLATARRIARSRCNKNNWRAQIYETETDTEIDYIEKE